MSRMQRADATVPSADLSVVLVASEGLDSIRTALSYLRRQTIAGRIELVVVAGSPDRFTPPTVDEFAGVVVVQARHASEGEARARGVHAATAPIVAFTEDHAFPRDDWAACLLSAFDGPWSAVGPALDNANPATLTSWANLYIAYGRWAAPAASGERSHLPGHNSAYRRDVLLAQGERLAGWLGREWQFHEELRRAGHRLFLQADAETRHQNMSNFKSALQLRFLGGRVSAAVRARDMSASGRALRVAAAPLIPLVRLREVIAFTRRTGRDRPSLVRLAPTFIALLAVSGIGEAIGFAIGAGGAVEAKETLEHNRALHLSARDAAEFAAFEASVREADALSVR